VRYWVANTDLAWFEFLAARAPLDEVNFWAPSGIRPITLPHGAPWIFKLHVRDGGQIVGGGFFAHYTPMTARWAWETFGEGNGAPSLLTMVRQIEGYRRQPVDPDSTQIGSSLIVQPFFLPRELWIEPPADWSPNLTRGKTYDTELGEGRVLWDRLQLARAALPALDAPAITESPLVGAYGSPVLVRPRLGQGTFRVMVTDAYERRCVVTNERTLPVLEAAHIKPYSQSGPHAVSNGLLLRSDLHTLFDRGYVTVTPDHRFRVSRKIKEEFANGRDYYALDRREVRLPTSAVHRPSLEYLEWHADTLFRG
jgi:putative restriction endonuclease